MAVAVPFLMATAGASTAAIAITSVAFAVTGINDKINKAAADVFGEDLVKIGNIAGMAYGAFSDGGFDLSGSAEMGPPVSAMEMGPPTSAMEMGPPTSAMDTGVSMDADIAGGLNPSLPETAPFQAGSASDTAMQTFGTSADPEPFNLKTLRDAEPANAGASAASPTAEAPMASSPPSTGATSPVATAPQQAVQPLQATQTPQTPAVQQQATAPMQASPTPQATQPPAAAQTVQAAKPAMQVTPAADAAPVSESFIDKLIRLSTDPKTGQIKNGVLTLGGDILKGVAAGYTAAQQRQQYDDEIARRDRLANLGGAGWVQRR